MNDAALFWTKVAAIGQVAGAIATFLAVVVALALSRAERQLKVRVRARFMTIVTVGGNTPVMSYEVENIGLRPVVVTGIHWSTGLINWFGLVPKPFRLKSAFQMPDYEWAINPPFPWRLEPGESKSTHIRRGSFLEELADPNDNDLFRRFFWQKRPRLFVHRVGVAVGTRDRVVFGKVDPKITKALHDGYRG